MGKESKPAAANPQPRHQVPDTPSPATRGAAAQLNELRVRQTQLERQLEDYCSQLTETENRLKRYTDLYDQAPVAHFVLDRAATILHSNLQGAHILSLAGLQAHQQPQHQQFTAFVDQASQPIFNAFLQRIFSRQARGACEVTLQVSRRIVQIEAVFDAARQTLNAIVIDITANRTAEVTAQKNHDLLNNLIARVPGTLYQFRLDPDGSTHFTYVSENIPNLYGISVQQACEDSSTLFSRVHPEDAAGLDASMLRSADTLGMWRHAYRMILPDGTAMWRALDARPERLANGSTLWHGYTIDITERKQMEDSLRENEERWKLALEGAGHGVWDWELQSGTTLFSKRWKEILGYAEHEIGNDANEWISRVHPNDMPIIVESQSAIIEQRRNSDSVEFRLLCKDGSWKWMLGSGILVKRDTEGRALRMVGTLSDITQRKKTEEKLCLSLVELEERRREAENHSATKSRFLNAASHDLRQPLYASQLFADALASESLSAQQQEILQNLQLSIKAMSAQLQMLLDVSRLDMGNIVPQLRNIALASICQNLEATYAPIARNADVLLRFLPGWGIVHTDAVLIGRLLGNLIDNAIKFSQHGVIVVCARRSAQGIRIEVRDNGPGIAPEHRQQIFDEYYQIDNPARNPNVGLGLGLSIAQRISHLLNVPLTLQTRFGNGAVFAVTLPAVSTDRRVPENPDVGAALFQRCPESK